MFCITWEVPSTKRSDEGGVDEQRTRSASIAVRRIRLGYIGVLPGGKVIPTNRQTRRALSNINKNIIGAPVYPSAVNKRPFTKKNGICNKKIPLHCIVWLLGRKFAAQLAENNPQIHKEETKKPDLISNETLDRIIIDVEEGDFIEPMFVQHTEAMLEEIDRMEGIEMEDSNDIDVEVEESVMDIDSCDKNNPLVVVEYIDDIYCFYKKNIGYIWDFHVLASIGSDSKGNNGMFETKVEKQLTCDCEVFVKFLLDLRIKLAFVV
ncbi:unnamed protein product [Arabidopsis lyrata]|nr:unnamed protein product [Arabidopsis lyrata]